MSQGKFLDEGCYLPEHDPRRVFEEIARLKTEMQNPRTHDLDLKEPEEVLRLLYEDLKEAWEAVEPELPKVLTLARWIHEVFEREGRVIYVGAGTSGRIGATEAAEMLPTFSAPFWKFVALVAGGFSVLERALEHAEDLSPQGVWDMRKIGINAKDLVVGLSASGRTPYVLAALEFAKGLGCRTVMVSTNPVEKPFIDLVIAPNVGPEPIAGSTRMKSAFAQKLVLQLASTTAMVMAGKVYGNLMVDLCAATHKLRERAKKIIMLMTGVTYEEADSLLREAGGSAKVAILMKLKGLSREEALSLLERCGRSLRRALGQGQGSD